MNRGFFGILNDFRVFLRTNHCVYWELKVLWMSFTVFVDSVKCFRFDLGLFRAFKGRFKDSWGFVDVFFFWPIIALYREFMNCVLWKETPVTVKDMQSVVSNSNVDQNIEKERHLQLQQSTSLSSIYSEGITTKTQPKVVCLW